MAFHIKHAVTHGMTDIKVWSSDTDDIIILLGVYHSLASINCLNDAVVDFATKKNQKVISNRSFLDSLVQTCCRALVFFYALQILFYFLSCSKVMLVSQKCIY